MKDRDIVAQLNIVLELELKTCEKLQKSQEMILEALDDAHVRIVVLCAIIEGLKGKKEENPQADELNQEGEGHENDCDSK